MRQAKQSHQGFTLIEMLIVTSVISILAGVAVPRLVRAKATANEGAVISVLRTVATVQAQFRSMDLVDVDRDGAFEYGTLREITGLQSLRGSSETLSPPMLSTPLGAVDAAGRVVRHGYYLAMALPDAAGTGLAETPANLGNIDPAMAHSLLDLCRLAGGASSLRADHVLRQPSKRRC